MLKENDFELSFKCIEGTTAACHPDTLDPELISAFQNVSEVVCRFVDNYITLLPRHHSCEVIPTVSR